MIDVAMPTWFRKGLYGLYATAWCSGLSFFALKTWFVVEGEFGPVKHGWQFPALQLHGAAAFLMMITFGFLLGAHVQYCWNLGQQKKRGIVIITLSASLIVSAYLLYYIAQDDVREVVEYVHLAIGFSLPFALIAHVWKRKKQSELPTLPSMLKD